MIEVRIGDKVFSVDTLSDYHDVQRRLARAFGAHDRAKRAEEHRQEMAARLAAGWSQSGAMMWRLSAGRIQWYPADGDSKEAPVDLWLKPDYLRKWHVVPQGKRLTPCGAGLILRDGTRARTDRPPEDEVCNVCARAVKP